MKALRHIIIYGFMSGIFFQASLATAMDCIVVNSTVAHLPTGTKLLLQSNIDILDEQQVKIVCEDARSKVMHGPYQGPVEIPAAGQPQKESHGQQQREEQRVSGVHLRGHCN